MMPDLQLLAFLRELATSIGLDGEIEIDESGACAFEFEDGTIVLAKGGHGDGLLWLYSRVGEPASGSEAYAELLHANLAGCGGSGLIFSLPQDGVPGVIAAVPIAWQAQTAPAVADILARFLDAMEVWSREIAATSLPHHLQSDAASISS